jgi:hypothetical protein
LYFGQQLRDGQTPASDLVRQTCWARLLLAIFNSTVKYEGLVNDNHTGADIFDDSVHPPKPLPIMKEAGHPAGDIDSDEGQRFNLSLTHRH